LKRVSVVVVGLFLLSVLHARAQDPAYTLQVRAKLVVLDVVVTDAKGKPVTGLPQEAFHVYEDKLPQKILSFTPPASDSAVPAAPVEVNSTAELDRKEPQSPVSILVLDELTASFEDQAFARYSVKKYLEQEGDVLRQPTMLMAVGIGHQMVLRDYTTSKKEILDALANHFAATNWQQQTGSWQGEQFKATFAALIGVAQATMGHPGHKNMVWIGRGFPAMSWENLEPEQEDALQPSINICTNLLRDARVTLYTVDPAGVSADPPAQDADGFYIDDPFGGDVDFDNMARATGGQAFHGRNDVDHLIGTSVSDGEKFYTITYRPTSASDDPKQFRKVQVLMADRSMTANTREGYYSASQPLPPALNEKHEVAPRTKFDIVEASEGLMVYDGVPLSITREADQPDKFEVELPAAALQWTPDGDKGRSSVLVVIESFDLKGKLLHNEGRTFGLVLPPQKEDGPDKRVVTLPLTASTAPPAARLRIIVRADATGKIGADNVFLVDRKTLKDPSTGLKPKKQK